MDGTHDEMDDPMLALLPTLDEYVQQDAPLWGMLDEVEVAQDTQVAGSSPGSDRDRTAKPTVLKVLAPRRRVNNARRELEGLRDLAANPQTHVTFLKINRERRTAPVQSNEIACTVRGVWRPIALRQYERRQASELENSRLKMKLEEQYKIRQSLEMLLARAANHAMERPILLVPSQPHTSLARKCEELFEIVENMYLESERRLVSSEFGPPDSEHPKRSIKLGGMEICLQRILPLDLSALGSMLWRSLAESSMRSIETPEYVQRSLLCTADSVASVFHLRLDTPERRGLYRGTTATRRFRQEARDVAVSVVHFELIESYVSRPVESSFEAVTWLRTADVASEEDDAFDLTSLQYKTLARPLARGLASRLPSETWCWLIGFLFTHQINHIQNDLDNFLLAHTRHSTVSLSA